MITKIQTPSAINAYRQFPQEGTGTQTDPFDWYTVDTVVEAVSTVTVVEADEYDSIEKYYNIKLTASQLYTFSISGVDAMGTTVTIYYEGSQVAQSVFDDMEWTWSLSYTPSATGTYLIKVSTYSYGGGGTLSTTPLPTEITPWIEKSIGIYESTGFDADNNNLPKRYNSAFLAGIIKYPPNVVFALIASSGLKDKSATPVALTADGTLKISNGAFDFTSGGWRILAASTEKLNLGAGNWTVEIIASGAPPVTKFPSLLGSSNGWTGGFGFVYKHSLYYSNTVGMSWEAVGDPSITGSSSLTDDTVYKMRFVRSENTLYYYQDDVLNNTEAIPSGHENDVLNFNNNGGGLHIGRNNWDGSDGQFYGKIYSIIIRNVAIL